MKRISFLLCLLMAGLGIIKADDTYVKVTSSDQLVNGAEYILAVQTDSKVYIADALVENSYLSTGAEGTNVGENLITVTSGNPLFFTLGGDANGYTLKYKNTDGNDRYITRSSSTMSNLIDTNFAIIDRAMWTYDPTTCKLSNVSDATRFLSFRQDTNIKQIRAYNSSNYPLACLYIKSSNTGIISLNQACTDGAKYYGTYSSGKAFVVPDDLTVSKITVDSEGTLTITDYQTGDVVPANTGVMVSSTTYGEHPVMLSDEEKEPLLDTENYLYPSGNGISAKEMAEEHPDCMYYRLTMHNGETLGYYWGANGGGCF